MRRSYLPSGYCDSRPFGTPSITYNNPASVMEQHYCADDTGYPVDHGLDITHRNYQGLSPLNGVRPSVLGYPWHTKMENFYPPSSTVAMDHLSLSTDSDATISTAALARSNPNRITVGLPQFTYELRDLPGMYRDILAYKLNINNIRKANLNLRASGRNAVTAREVANHHLAAQMGWIPLVNDIRKLLKFHDHVEKRIQELDRLSSKGGLKRVVQSRSNSKTVTAVGTEFFAFSSTGVQIKCRKETTTSLRVWSTVRWKPTFPSSFNRMTSKARRRLAGRLVLGLSSGQIGVQAWNLIPWTWLIGWCVNVDDFLSSYNNTVPVTHSNICVMRNTKTTENWTRTDTDPYFSGLTGQRTFERKARSVFPGPTLTAAIPFLGARQLSILASLAIQRLR